MTKQYLSIQDAADLCGKSAQTIRRAIKAKKLSARRVKTPQGFNYSVNRLSLCELYNLPVEEQKEEKAVEAKVEEPKAETQAETPNKSEAHYITSEDFQKFTGTLERMVNTHTEERQNFLRLVNTLQEKIFVLENQMNLLKEPKKKWYQVFK